jgi:superfamily II DNA or RNA helicase
MEHQITVKKYLSEKKRILKIIAQAIDSKDKIHINAPVGSGKTSLILKLIQRYTDKQFLILFPQISITEQVRSKLTDLNIESCIVNGDTIKRVIKNNGGTLTNSMDDTLFSILDNDNKINKNGPKDLPDRVFLTTIDQTYKLIDELKFDNDQTIVVVDETHTFLTSARDNHTISVEKILRNGFPIVGFSATPSTWVNKKLFGIDNYITINATKIKNPVVTRISVQNGAIRTLAHEIALKNKTLTVVFTKNISTQNKLKELINEYNSNITVCCLNSETNTSTEKVTWDYLMKKDELQAGANVFILNSVVQSGINILNSNIDSVYLFGEFDPFGFVQYLGRCRNYKEQFIYYHSPYSKQLVLFGSDEIQEKIDWMTNLLDASSDNLLPELKILMGNLIYKVDDQNQVVNKCMVATLLYERLKDLSGEVLTNAVSSMFNDIKFVGVNTIQGLVITPAKSKAQSRAKAKSDLVESIKKLYPDIIKVFIEMGYDYTEATLVHTIKVRYGGLTILKQQYDKMNKMVDFMKMAQMTPHRLSTAAYLYKNSGKSDGVLEEYINMHNNTAGNISDAITYFASFSKSNPTYKKAIKELQSCVGDAHSAELWKNIVCRVFPGLNKIPGLTDDFYKFCLRTKRSNSKLKLEGINTSLNDYIEGLGLEHITVVNGKIAPK